MCAESVSDFVGVRLPVVGSVAVRSAESCFSSTSLFIRNNTEITHRFPKKEPYKSSIIYLILSRTLFCFLQLPNSFVA